MTATSACDVLIRPSISFFLSNYSEITLSHGRHLAVFIRQIAILLATMIKRRVALPSTAVRQTEHAAVVWPTPTLVSFTPIMPHHGPTPVARIPCHIQSLPPCSSPLSWSAAMLPLVDNIAVCASTEFLLLQAQLQLQARHLQYLLPPVFPQHRIPLQTHLIVRVSLPQHRLRL